MILCALQLMLATVFLGTTKALVAPESSISDSCLFCGKLHHKSFERVSRTLGLKIFFTLMQLTAIEASVIMMCMN